MIFVDSNIVMYLIGSDEAHRVRAQLLVDSAIHAREQLVTDAEVMQEILHRYAAIRRLDAIEPAFALLGALADDVLPVTGGDVRRASEIMLASHGRLSARDALHLAVMQHAGIRRIMTFDSDFDSWPAAERVIGEAPT